MINSGNTTINEIYYQNHLITKIYSCGGQLVYEYETPPIPPIGTFKFRATDGDIEDVEVPCDSTGTITSSETGSESVKHSKTLEIGTCVTEIGANAFNNCYAFSGLTIPSNVITISSHAFYNFGSQASLFTGITLSEGLQTIGEDAFANSLQLERIVIPNSVTTIGRYAFRDSEALTSIEIGSGITFVGSEAFSIDNPQVQYAKIYATTPPTLEDERYQTTRPFRGNYPILVPSQSVSAYQSAWPTMATRVQAMQ